MDILSKKLHQLLNSASLLSIIMHQNPDGDAMGSALAMAEFLENSGVKSKIFSSTSIAPVLDWMPGRDKIVIFDSNNNIHIDFINNSDTILFVDHSVAKQSGEIFDYLNISDKKSAFIDHHPQPSLPVDIGYSVVNSAANCCIIYQLLKKWNANITKTMANCLYTGICTDTGNFKYGNNLAETFQIVSEMLNMGVDREQITYSLFYNASLDSLRLLGFVLSEKMQLATPEIAYISISKEEMEQYNVKQGDTDNIVNYPLSIKGVNVSAIFMERDDYIKISFRSKGNWNVSTLAHTHFNGGGHKNASGGRYYGSLDDAIKKYIKQLT